jgi:DNA-binding XRE family transcriptional regulator
MRPTPTEIRAARHQAAHTQVQAAATALVSLRGWIKYERGERPMPAAVWALYRLRTGQLTLVQLERESG